MKTANENFKLIGKVKAARGLGGEIFVLVFSKQTSWAKKIKNIGLGADASSLQVFQVEKIKPYKEGLILSLAGITDRNQSEKLKGLMCFIPETLLSSAKGERIFLSEILGFQIRDGEKLVGEIKSFSSNGPQDILVVENGSATYEIPFVEAFIVKIEFERRLIQMNLPEGLLSLETGKSK
jgi:16S rRNA processing protein RimM